MASVSVKSGGSIKARKGNGFEFNTAYSMMLSGYEVKRPDTNIAGVDLIASIAGVGKLFIECKFHKKFSWNELEKYYKKTEVIAKERGVNFMIIFKSNQQPVLIMMDQEGCKVVIKYDDYFGVEWQKRPKGYRIFL